MWTRNVFISLLPLLSIVFAIGCESMSTQVIKQAGNNKPADQIGKAGNVVISSTADQWGTDEYTISAATVQDDTLSVNVSYTGKNPETHVFTLVAEPMFLESFPVQLRVSLAHNANGDTGNQESFSEDYHFNLTPIKEVYQRAYRTDEGTIILRLKEAPPSNLAYDF